MFSTPLFPPPPVSPRRFTVIPHPGSQFRVYIQIHPSVTLATPVQRCFDRSDSFQLFAPTCPFLLFPPPLCSRHGNKITKGSISYWTTDSCHDSCKINKSASIHREDKIPQFFEIVNWSEQNYSSSLDFISNPRIFRLIRDKGVRSSDSFRIFDEFRSLCLAINLVMSRSEKTLCPIENSRLEI